MLARDTPLRSSVGVPLGPVDTLTCRYGKYANCRHRSGSAGRHPARRIRRRPRWGRPPGGAPYRVRPGVPVGRSGGV